MAAPLTPAPPRRAFEEPGAALDFDKVERNVRSMVAQNAPEADIDGYLASEGLTAEKFAAAMAGKTRTVGDDVKGAGVYVDRLGRKFASGGTFGGADEISAATNAAITGGTKMAGIPGPGSQAPSFGERYDANVDAERKIDKDFTRENPIAATAAEIGGNIAGTAALLRQFPGLAPLLGGGGISAPMAMRMAKTAAGGMALGGAGGFLSGEGGFGPRALNAGLGAAVGGTIGAALPPVAAGASAVGRMIAESAPGRFVGEKVVAPVARAVAGMADDATPRVPAGALSAAAPEGGPGVALDGPAASMSEAARRVAEGSTSEAILRRGAVERLARDLAADKITPQQAAAEYERLMRMGRAPSLLDVGGENTEGTARAVAMMRGEGRTIARNAVDAVKDGQGARVRTDLDMLAPGAKFLQTADEIMGGASKAAAPKYRVALDVPPPSSDRLNQFLADPIMQRGLARGVRLARLESLAEGKPFVPGEWGVTGFNDAGEAILGRVPTMRTLDAGKRGLDDLLAGEAYRNPLTGKLSQEGRAIDMVRRAFVAELDRLNPLYAPARAAWSGPAASREALEIGRAALRENSEITAKELASMTPGDREFARIGLRTAIEDMMKSTPDGANKVRKFFGNEAFRERIAAAFEKPQDFAEFAARMMAETAKYNRAARVDPRVGSKSIPSAIDVASVASEGVPSAASIPGFLFKKGADWMARAKAGNAEVRNELARILFNPNAPENIQLLDELARIVAAQGQGGAHPAVMGAATQALPSAIGGIIGGR